MGKPARCRRCGEIPVLEADNDGPYLGAEPVCSVMCTTAGCWRGPEARWDKEAIQFWNELMEVDDGK